MEINNPIQMYDLTVKRELLSNITMSTKPPTSVKNAGNKVIDPTDKKVKEWVGIGWITLRNALSEDYINIPEIIE